MKCRLMVVFDGDVVEIGPPCLARIEAQLFLRLTLQQVPGALDVRGGKRLTVVPLDALVQFERQILAVLAPAPAMAKIGDDIVESVLLLVLVEQNEVVENGHDRRHDRNRALFVDRHVGGAVAVIDAQRTALLLRFGSGAREQGQQGQDCPRYYTLPASHSESSLSR